MTLRLPLAATLLALPFVATPALAAGKITAAFEDHGKDGFSVSFEDPSCGGECYYGSFSCNSGGGNVEFEFGDVASKDAALIVGSEQHAFKIAAGKTAITFNAAKLTFTEMNGSWVMSGQSFEDTDKLLAAMKSAKTFTATAGKTKLDLPVTEDVKTWIKRCGG